MHSFEQLVVEWRKSVAELGVGSKALDELESHLRETVDHFVRSGSTEIEAFKRAEAQLGPPSVIARELRKLKPPIWLPLKLAMGFGIFLAVAMAALLAMETDRRGLTLLLRFHVWTVTLGFGGTLLLGGMGVCFVCQSCFSDFCHHRLESLKRASFIFSGLAAILTALGIVLGMIWAKETWGRYWAWDAKETGAFCILAWLVFSTAIHYWKGISTRVVLLLSLVGNIVVCLGWFGASLVASELHSYGANSLLIPTVVMAPSAFFFLVGLLPTGWMRLTKN